MKRLRQSRIDGIEVPSTYRRIDRCIRQVSLVLAFALLIALTIGSAMAISGSGGGMSVYSSPGALSYNGDSGSLNTYGGSLAVNGQFNNTQVNGRFGPGLIIQSSLLNILLQSPLNDSATYFTSVNFTYLPSSPNIIANCTLVLDSSPQSIDTSITNGSSQIFSANGLSYGVHTWLINCSDTQGSAVSLTRSFNVIHSTSFNGNSTDLSIVNISAVTNFTLDNSGVGTIRFPQTLDLSGLGDIESNVIISDKTVTINSGSVPSLNRSAIVTLSNVSYSTAFILKDGALCTSCNILSLSGGVIVFNVTGFSTYTIVGTTRLYTSDTTDTNLTHANESVTFYANYSSTLDGSPILGSCNISFAANGWTQSVMAYDASALLYNYTTTFATPGIGLYNITCINSVGFDNVTVSDAYAIAADSTIKAAETTATTIGSSRFDANTTAGSTLSSGGNVSELIVDGVAISNSWQGYYGNVTGVVGLKDSTGNSLYNWNITIAAGEIYAARTPDVNWNNVGCANAPLLTAEDAYLGMNSTSDESLENTFFTGRTFDSFYVGTIQITDSQGCYSTNLFNASGAQTSHYAQILLTDGSEMIYTGLIDRQVYGFDGRAHDFQMLVAENGQDEALTTYYFFVELG